MECDKWVEEGLLQSSGELENERKHECQRHLSSCQSCSEFIEDYHHDKRRYFTPEILGYPTTPSLDERIKEACGKTPKPATSLSLFTTIARRVAAAGLFLAVGIGGSLYFVYNAEHVRMREAHTGQLQPASVEEDAHLATSTVDEDIPDSAKADSGTAESSATVVKRGGAGTTGVLPVDLQDD